MRKEVSVRENASRSRACSQTRRGSVYLVVLSTATIAAGVAIGTIALAQSTQKSVIADAEWDRACTAAQSGLEVALARMNTDTTWRRSLTSGAPVTGISVGDANVDLVFVDERNGDLRASITEPVRVYARATVGSAVRVGSALIDPIGAGTGLDVLRTAAHSSQDVRNSGATTASLGPVSAQGGMNNSGVLTGDVEARALTNTGKVKGLVTENADAKTMPDGGIFQTLAARATPVPLSGSSVTFSDTVMVAQGIPLLGVSNGEGLYRMTAAAGQTVTFTNMRLKASIVITLSPGATLILKEPLLWEPASAGLPALVIKGDATSNVSFVGASGALTESLLVNFNPVTAPYNGVSDLDYADSYPSASYGVTHIIGSSVNVTVSSNYAFVGTLISESPISVAQGKFTADAGLVSAPPEGYSSLGVLRPRRGTYRWETDATWKVVASGPPTAAAPGVGVTISIGGLNIGVGLK